MSSIGRRQRVLMTSRASELGTCKVKYSASSCPLSEGASISSAPKLGALVRLADCNHAFHTASIGSVSRRSSVVYQIVEELDIFTVILPIALPGRGQASSPLHIYERHTLYLYQGLAWQFGHSDGGASGSGSSRRFKITGVDRVHRLKIAHTYQKDGRLDDIGKRRMGARQDCLQVLQDSMSLCLDIAIDK